MDTGVSSMIQSQRFFLTFLMLLDIPSLKNRKFIGSTLIRRKQTWLQWKTVVNVRGASESPQIVCVCNDLHVFITAIVFRTIGSFFRRAVTEEWNGDHGMAEIPVLRSNQSSLSRSFPTLLLLLLSESVPFHSLPSVLQSNLSVQSWIPLNGRLWCGIQDDQVRIGYPHAFCPFVSFRFVPFLFALIAPAEGVVFLCTTRVRKDANGWSKGQVELRHGRRRGTTKHVRSTSAVPNLRSRLLRLCWLFYLVLMRDHHHGIHRCRTVVILRVVAFDSFVFERCWCLRFVFWLVSGCILL